MKLITQFLTRSAIVGTLTLSMIQAADVAGSKDHPLFKRIEGSEILFQKNADYDELKIALGKLEWSGAEAKLRPYQSATVEGKRSTIYYLVPKGIGVLEALRNYQTEFKEKGFEILFSGRGDEIQTTGYGNHIGSQILKIVEGYQTPEAKAAWMIYTANDKEAGYAAVKKSGESGEVYASVYVLGNTQKDWLAGKVAEGQTVVRLDVCEVKAREQRMVLVKSDEMASQISLNGRIALYGILFDFNSAAIKPESEPTLEQIAKLMQEKPELKVLVVGHTDIVGSFEINKGLSQKRAESVVKHLFGKYAVGTDRLFPVGVSFASPVATNATEEGRAKNRRVELVDMSQGKIQ